MMLIFSSKTTTLWLKILILSVFFVFAYWGALDFLLKAWVHRPTYSHGFLVPLVSLYFIWAMRSRLARIEIKPNLIVGFVVVLVSGFLNIVGDVSSMPILQGGAILIFFPGLVLTIFGLNILKALSLPLSYLILMVPVLDALIYKIQWPFQILSAQMAVKFLRMIDIPVFLNKNIIELPNITLEVAKACSGVQYLIAITAIAIPLAYFYIESWKRRTILFVSALCIGIIANWLRIILVSWWAYTGGQGLHGPFHIFQGLFVSMFGYLVLFILTFLFNKYEKTSSRKDKFLTKQRAINNVAYSKDYNLSSSLSWLVVTVILGFIGFFLHFHEVEAVPLKKPLEKIPMAVNGWKGRILPDYYTPPFINHNPDSKIAIAYENTTGQKLYFYVGYFASQSENKEIIHYHLQTLYDKSSKIDFNYTKNKNIMMNKALFPYEDKFIHAIYWYNINGKNISDNIKAKFTTAFDGIIFNKTNGAFIIIYSETDMFTTGDIVSEQKSFIKKFIPILNNFFSDNLK